MATVTIAIVANVNRTLSVATRSWRLCWVRNLTTRLSNTNLSTVNSLDDNADTYDCSESSF